ncbi:MalY/PatB family protein [Cohnella cellulosilytica]|uniref:cysteine-S-conjugate beta-lyase n=1 Tax=Cohnella cellulosilytica TaxID=986710 RepID=A0ABW2FC00_9BACL
MVNSFFWTVQAFTKPGDAVLVCSPVYYPFYHAVEDNGRLLVCSELVNTEGEYAIDFDDFEAQIEARRVKLFIHCSPHNPVGRVWTEEELRRIFDICTKHGVIVVSDEIHLDFTRPGTEFVSALKLKSYFPNLIVLHSASKTFNLAGLLHSHLIIPDERLREVYDAHAKQVNKAATSVMGLIATEACYREGREWLDGLRGLIEHNYGLLKNEFAERLPRAVLSEKEGTYLAWLDLRNCAAADQVRAAVQDKCGLAVDYGEWFGEKSQGFIRINLATVPEHIRFAAEQISKHFSIS